MADIQYLYAIGEDINGDAVQFEIWGPDDGRGSVEFTAGFPFINIEWQRSEDDIFNDAFMFSEARVQLIIKDNIQRTLIEEIAGSLPNEHAVRILIDNVQYWTGILLPETLVIGMDCNPTVIDIRAVDGFRTLTDYKEHDITQTMAWNVYKILNNLPNWQFYPTSAQSIFFQPQIEVTGGTGNVFTDCEFQGIFDNDFEYLKAILNDLAMTMYHADGYYYIVGLLDIASGSFSGTWYKEDSLTAISSTTLNYTIYDINQDIGGVQMFTRPYNSVRAEYKRRSNIAGLVKEETYSPDEDTDTINLINTSLYGDYPEDYSITIEYTVKLTKTTGDNTELNEVLFLVKSGTFYYVADTKSWTSVALGYAHENLILDNPNTDIIINGTFDLPLGEAPNIGIFPLQIDVIWLVTDDNGVGQNSVNKASVSLKITYNKDQEIFYETTSAAPQYLFNHNFNDNNFVLLDKVYSNSLGDYVDDNWNYSTYPDDFLHILKAKKIADLIGSAISKYEFNCDNLHGPAAFYRIQNTIKMLPLRIDMDLQRKEGQLLGLKV